LFELKEEKYRKIRNTSTKVFDICILGYRIDVLNQMSKEKRRVKLISHLHSHQLSYPRL